MNENKDLLFTQTIVISCAASFVLLCGIGMITEIVQHFRM